jgi:lipopolysaccharide export system protein LptA
MSRVTTTGKKRHPAASGACRALLCCLLAVLAPVAWAEKADREKPVNLEADRVTIDDGKQLAIFEGNVVLTQGTLVIRGNRMEVRQDKEGFKSGITWGSPAHFRQKREGFDEYIEGWAERLEYDGRVQFMQMFNRALLTRGQDEVRGNYISYDGRTEFFQVTGGGAQAAAPDNPDGRAAASPPVDLKSAPGISRSREETRPRGK